MQVGATVEARKRAEALVAVGERYGLDLPICQRLVDLVEGRCGPREAVHALMQRSLRGEQGSVLMDELASGDQEQRAVLIEAFAAGPLQGNGAAVVELTQAAQSEWMQALAGSLQQSETAFLWRNPDGQWCLRWFTPTCEVPLCGHATLASTLALQQWGLMNADQELVLASRSGGLRVSVDPSTKGAASFVLPSEPLVTETFPSYLAGVLNGKAQGYWKSTLGYRVVLIGEDQSLATLTGVSERLQGPDRHGLVVMQALAGDRPQRLFGHPCDYQLRFFAPGLGIDEDPVTGSAHALVAPWWADQLSKRTLHGWQPSRRSGGMRCEVLEGYQVQLSGTGHALWDGHIQAGSPGHNPDAWGVCRMSAE